MKALPIVISYAYAKVFDWAKVGEQSKDLDLIIDCGAYTAHRKGKLVTLEEYYEFLGRIDFPIIGYFALDSIGDPVQTWKNFIHMKESGFDPIPIFTRGDEIGRLNDYYSHADTVALGGLWAGGENDPGYVKWIMENGFQGRKTHWLGFAVHDLMLHYRPYSVDAINWKRALLYGQLVVWTGRGFEKATRQDFAGKGLPRIGRYIRQLGYDPYKLKSESSWRGIRTYAHEICTVSFLRYVRTLKERVDIRFYFVCNAQHELDFLLKLYKEGGYGSG